MKTYECIKPFNVPCYDTGTDFYDEIQRYNVEVGSVWEREEDDDFSYTGADIHLEGDAGWLEISEEKLKECFKELGEEE